MHVVNVAGRPPSGTHLKVIATINRGVLSKKWRGRDRLGVFWGPSIPLNRDSTHPSGVLSVLYISWVFSTYLHRMFILEGPFKVMDDGMRFCLDPTFDQLRSKCGSITFGGLVYSSQMD